MTWREACGGGSAARIAYEGEFGESLRRCRKKKAAIRSPLAPTAVRLSRLLRTPAAATGDEPISARRVFLWSIVGAAVIAGIVLYFRYARQIIPVLG
jgi:hypothetical protein